MKKYFLITLMIFISLFVFAQEQTDTNNNEKYQITEIEYNLDGRTKPYALDQKLDIDKKTIFNSKTELDAYIDYIRQTLINQRVLQESSMEYETGNPNKDGIIPVKIIITAEDTWNIFPVPYPKYNSNSGLEFKLKVKDYNFFGSMEEMNFDLVFFQEDEGEENNVGLGIDFAIPFSVKNLDVIWDTDANIEYTLGENKTGFSFESGLDISFPFFDIVTPHLILSQKIEQETDEEYIDIGDKLFLTEYAEFNLEFTIANSNSILDKVILKPYTSIEYNWDKDGVKHEDLIGPRLGFGADLTGGNTDWINNFRNGLEINIAQDFIYNFGKKTDKLCPKVSLDTKAYYATEYVGLNTRLNAFTYYGMNNPEKDNIGSSLRGIRDDEDKYNNGQIETSSAIVFNFDIPVKVVQTDWRAWGKKLLKKDMPSWFRYFDFELQISPFFDLALIRNTITGNLFNPKDGFYSAGLEIIVFPTKMRSIQVRVSAGTDISSYIADAEWRTKTSPEIQIGVGLHY